MVWGSRTLRTTMSHPVSEAEVLAERVRNGNAWCRRAWARACAVADTDHEEWCRRMEMFYQGTVRLDGLCQHLIAAGYDRCLYAEPRDKRDCLPGLPFTDTTLEGETPAGAATMTPHRFRRCPQCQEVLRGGQLKPLRYGERHWHDRGGSLRRCPVCGWIGFTQDFRLVHKAKR